MNNLFSKFMALPRVAQWAIEAIAFLIVFFGIVKPVWSLGDSVGDKASRLESAIARRNDFASPASGDGANLAAYKAAFGTPMMPKDGGLKPEAFTRVVDSVLESHNVTDRNVTERRIRMTKEQSDVLGPFPIDRLIEEVTFEADPATVVAILAELERSPEVAAVSRVRLDRASVRGGMNLGDAEDEQHVRATITPEAWIVASNASGFSSGDSSSVGGLTP
jgi:hypothetical protein